MFTSNFIVTIQCNGQTLREKDGYVSLPFGSEYSIGLKNMDSRRVIVKVSIDGQDVLDRSRLVIPGSGPGRENTLFLEGFLKGSDVSNKFKFIQKTREIANYRGDRIDDGIVRVEFQFEEHYQYYTGYPFTIKSDFPCGTSTYSGKFEPGIGWSYLSSTTENLSRGVHSFYNSTKCCNQAENLNMQADIRDIQKDEGITVKGSHSNQKFDSTTIGGLGISHVITLKLRGITEEQVPIQKPLLTREKLTCSTCGRSSSSGSNFCSNCGTCLN